MTKKIIENEKEAPKRIVKIKKANKNRVHIKIQEVSSIMIEKSDNKDKTKDKLATCR